MPELDGKRSQAASGQVKIHVRSGSWSSIVRPAQVRPGHPRTEPLERGIDLQVVEQGIDTATVESRHIRHALRPRRVPARTPRGWTALPQPESAAKSAADAVKLREASGIAELMGRFGRCSSRRPVTAAAVRGGWRMPAPCASAMSHTAVVPSTPPSADRPKSASGRPDPGCSARPHGPDEQRRVRDMFTCLAAALPRFSFPAARGPVTRHPPVRPQLLDAAVFTQRPGRRVRARPPNGLCAPSHWFCRAGGPQPCN